jgi:hypothetical protein
MEMPWRLEKLAAAKDALWIAFGDRRKSMGEMMRDVMEGEPIARNDFEGIRSFVISLLRPYRLAGRMGEAFGRHKFDIRETYIDLMRAKLPHLIPEWTEEFDSENVQDDLTINTFKSFVLKVTKNG